MTSSTELMQMNDKGVLPFKNSIGKWTVIYLNNGAGGLGGGVCEASFDSVFEAMKFAKELI